MNKGIPRALSAVLLGGAFAFFGCEKASQYEVSPKTTETSQAAMSLTSAEGAKSFQAAFSRYVDRVERGELIDPSGQYVAKGGKVVVDVAGHRVARPKFDAAKPSFYQHYYLQRNGEVAGTNTGGASIVCANEDCTPTGGAGHATSFVSSVDLGGSGYIYDLKLIAGNTNTTSAQRVLGAGYIKLDSDLNRGAGGAYIYLSFTRNPSQVLNGLEYYQNQPYSSPNDAVTNVEVKYGSLTSIPAATPYFYTVWLPNQNPSYDWSSLDLNAGARGEYLYSFQSKRGGIAPFREIGVISGISSSIQPPIGWERYPTDLNEGTGGLFVYLCFKR